MVDSVSAPVARISHASERGGAGGSGSGSGCVPGGGGGIGWLARLPVRERTNDQPHGNQKLALSQVPMLSYPITDPIAEGGNRHERCVAGPASCMGPVVSGPRRRWG